MKKNYTRSNICHLINNPSPERGGAQKILAKLASPDEEIFSISPTPRAFTKILPINLIMLTFTAIKLIKLKPDIAYIHSRCFLPLSWVLKAIGSKSIFYAHANYRKHLWLYKLFPCNHYIAVSESVKKSLLMHSTKEKMITTITNPYIGEAHVGTYPAPQSPPLKIGFIGSLNSWKGITEAINLIYRIAPEIKGGISFKIVGDGPLMGQIEKLKSIATKDFEILISGYQEAPFEILKDSQVLLIPSLEEGFGLVAIEGIYQGKIVIYNKIPALAEICEDDPLSFSFDIQSPPSLLSAIKEAMYSIGSLGDTKLSQRRSDFIATKYGLDNFKQKHQSLRESMLN